MEEFSYDGTEQTPQPKQIRPPAPQSQQRSLSALSHRLEEEAIAIVGTRVDFSNNDLRKNHSSSQQYHSNSNKDNDKDMSSQVSSIHLDETLPTFEAAESRRLSAVTPARPSRFSFSGRTRAPLSEVRLSEPDSFFECVVDHENRDERSRDDGSDGDGDSEYKDVFERRTERSLRIPTPRNNATGIEAASSSIAMSISSSSVALDEDTVASHHRSRNDNLPPASPSVLEVSRVHESALQALLKLKEELVKSRAHNQRLIDEQVTMKTDWKRKEGALNEQHKSLQTSYNLVQASKKELEQRLAAIEKNEHGAAKEKQWLQRKMISDQRAKEYKAALDQTRQELRDTKQSHAQLANEMSILQEEKERVEESKKALSEELETLKVSSSQTISDLQTGLQSKQQELAQLTIAFSHVKDNHRNELDQLRQKNETQHNRLTELQEKHAQLQQQQQQQQQQQSSTPQFKKNHSVRFEDPSLESSVADRLARMRDSAERAHLIKAHKREVARLQMEHKHNMESMIDAHKEKLKIAQRESEAILESKLDNLKKTMKEEFEKSEQQNQKEHREKFAEMQQEYMKHQESADESLQTALKRISDLTQQYEREVSRRASFEMTTRELRQQIEDERRELQAHFKKEIEQKRDEWETERDTLLSVVQQDCNSAFERRRVHTPSVPYPSNHHNRSLDSALGQQNLMINTEVASAGRDLSQSGFEEDIGSPKTNLVSPAYSEIDEVLRETEDLIQSIM